MIDQQSFASNHGQTAMSVGMTQPMRSAEEQTARSCTLAQLDDQTRQSFDVTPSRSESAAEARTPATYTNSRIRIDDSATQSSDASSPHRISNDHNYTPVTGDLRQYTTGPDQGSVDPSYPSRSVIEQAQIRDPGSGTIFAQLNSPTSQHVDQESHIILDGIRYTPVLDNNNVRANVKVASTPPTSEASLSHTKVSGRQKETDDSMSPTNNRDLPRPPNVRWVQSELNRICNDAGDNEPQDRSQPMLSHTSEIFAFLRNIISTFPEILDEVMTDEGSDESTSEESANRTTTDGSETPESDEANSIVSEEESDNATNIRATKRKASELDDDDGSKEKD